MQKGTCCQQGLFAYCIYPERPQGGVLTAQGSVRQYTAEDGEDFLT